MAQREEFLKKICIEKYGTGKHEGPSLAELLPEQMKEVNKIYKELGGLLPTAPYKFRAYDIPLDNFIIELDEQEHFNRYRLKTLDSTIYKNYHNFDVPSYREYCKKYEFKCRTHGKYGNNPSTVKQFGPADPSFIAEDLGWSRWKQRAFYDLIKDAYSIAKNLPIVRLSIYDEYEGETINELLNRQDRSKLLAYVEECYQKAKRV